MNGQNLSGVLAGIPGLRGWQAQEQYRQQMQRGEQDLMQGEQTSQLNRMKLAEVLNARNEQKQVQDVLSQTNDPMQALPALLKLGTPTALAHAEKLKSLVPRDETSPLLANLRAAGIDPRGSEGQQIIRDFYAKGGDSNASPYYQFLPAEGGYAVGNVRTGGVVPAQIGGKPVVPAQYAPGLKRELSAATEEGKAIGEQRGMLPAKQDALTSVDNALGLLNKGIYTGAYAAIKKAGAKYTPGINTEKATRTEEFISEIGNTIVPRLKEFGGNDSNEELKYLRGISGGDITLEEGSLRNVLKRSQMKIQRGIDRANRGLDPNGNPIQQNQMQQKRIKFDAQGNMVQQ